MKKNDFDLLSEKYVKGQCSLEEVNLLEQWTTKNLDKTNIYQVLQNEEEVRLIENTIWDKLDSKVNKKEIWLVFDRKWLVSGLIAACLLLFLGMFTYINFGKVNFMHIQTTGIEAKNATNTTQKITLPDGSTVILAKNASIIVDQDYGKENRSVYLKGKGLFDVVKNRKAPFLVHVGNMVTEVLGTSFEVSPRLDGKMIEVSVIRGVVSVYAEGMFIDRKVNGVILTPNQMAIFDADNNTIQESIVDVPRLVVPQMNKSDFLFEEKSLLNIVEKFKYFYGVDIIIGNASMSNCTFTGDINGLDMYKQLELICSSINASYEIRGSTIFIQGNGCEKNINTK